MSPPRGGACWKWSDTENQSKPLATANFHSLRISSRGPPMWPMWIPNFIASLRASWRRSVQRRADLVHEQTHRRQDVLVGDLMAAVHLGEDSREPQHVGEAEQAIHDHL